MTDWKRIPGKKAGLGYWHKEYEAEVQHIITVQPSVRSEPSTSFVLQTQVRERPNEQYPWAPGDPELGRASFEEIKALLLERIRTRVIERRPRK